MDCSICLSAIKYNPKRLCCNHSFHKKCILNWIKHKNSCPLCIREIYNIQHITTDISWFNINFDYKNKLFCQINNYDNNKDYTVKDIIFKCEPINQELLYFPNLGYGIMIEYEDINITDSTYIGLYENNMLLSVYEC